MSSGAVVGGIGKVTANGTVLATFRIDSGSTVTIDRKNSCRRTCSVKLTSGFLVGSSAAVVPSVASDLFAPFGNELTLYYTSTVGGVETDTQVGVFLITDVDIDDSGNDLTMTVQGQDRARAYARAGFTDVYSIAASTNVATAIRSLLSTRSVGFTQSFNFAATTSVTPATPTIFGPGDDPWAKATDLAGSIGCELFMDAFGVTTLFAIPDPSLAAIAASYIEGVNNTAVSLKRALSNAECPNWVIRDGQGSGVVPPVRGVAKDTNAASATYIYGSYGTVTDYKSSSLYTTAAQALAAATADLLLAKGSVETVGIDIIPNPALDVDSVVQVTRARAGVTLKSYVIDAATIGFDASSPMSLTGRAVAPFS